MPNIATCHRKLVYVPPSEESRREAFHLKYNTFSLGIDKSCVINGSGGMIRIILSMPSGLMETEMFLLRQYFTMRSAGGHTTWSMQTVATGN